MKKTYIVQRMTNRNYNEYMSGGYNYEVENLHIEAETAEEAVKLAERYGYVVNEGYVHTEEEIAKMEAEKKAKYEAMEAKEAEAKAKAKATKEANEAKKAEAMGMTIAEYKEYKKAVAGVKRHEKEVERLEKELAYHKAKIAEYEAKIKK